VDEATEVVRKRRWPRRLGLTVLGLALLLVLAFAIVWPMREDLATRYINGELRARGVRATYAIRRIGLGTQVFENLALGDPRRPDLTARRVEVQVLIGLTGPRIGLITARGVRLHGRIENGRLTLGEVDKLLPPPSGQPFRLPDQRLDLKDAALDLATPAGRLAIGFAGRGNLADGFIGGVGLASHELRLGTCRLDGVVARLGLRVEHERPQVNGPAAIGRVACDGFTAERPLFALAAQLSPGLDRWRGIAATRVASLRAGAQTVEGIEGRVGFDGTADQTRGNFSINTRAAALGMLRSAGAAVAGRYDLAARRNQFAMEATLAVHGLRVAEPALASITSGLRGTRGTPLGPIGEALARAVLNAGRGGAEGEALLLLDTGSGGGSLRLASIDVASRSGARLTAPGGAALSYAWPSGALQLDRDFTLTGGGFPDTRLGFTGGSDGVVIGAGRIAPMSAGGARLALGEIAFTTGGGTTTFRTTALVDGPLGDGRVRGLRLPLTGRFGRGGFALGERCITAAFQALQIQGLAIGPSRLPICPTGRALLWSDGGGLHGGAELRQPRLAGRMGGVPVALAARRLRIDTGGFTALSLSVRTGWIMRISRFEAASLTGRFVPGGMAGRFAGLSGALAGVAIEVREGQGDWRLRGGTLSASGRLTAVDTADQLRFHPLRSDDVRLTLAGNRLHVTGTLAHPQSGTRVALATIEHDLASGVGRARLDVSDLRFTPQFQPEALTPYTVGVVALVDGSIAGQGLIEWDSRGSRSSGQFSTSNMNLAAPFGPVRGLDTTIQFTDLLGLTSAPHQEARVRLIQPGLDVYDGVIRYQLRPNYHVAIESGRWPFSGGTLTLEPTELDFSRESTKRLTFRVEGLDAARFIQQMEFSNIAATGTFDGVVPMEFTQSGGRIVGGRLAARPEGGTLSYVGELSDRDLGPYGILAFDALKSMRYSRLDLTMDGALDGEFITHVNLDGIARDVAGTREPAGGIRAMVVGRVLGQLARIPFHFNIRIQGRFRALLATARSFEDPSELIRAALPQLLETQPDNNVQPHESEPQP
jgi:translocation and assembly module TamB